MTAGLGPAQLGAVGDVSSVPFGPVVALAVSEVEPAGYALPASFVPDPWVSGTQEADNVSGSHGPTLAALGRELDGRDECQQRTGS